MVSSAPESRQLPVELAAEQVASLAAQPVVALKDLSYKVGVCFLKRGVQSGILLEFVWTWNKSQSSNCPMLIVLTSLHTPIYLPAIGLQPETKDAWKRFQCVHFCPFLLFSNQIVIVPAAETAQVA